MSEAGHVFVIEVQFRDGRRSHPAFVREGGADWKRRLDEAVEHFEELYRGQAVVQVNYARKLSLAGVASPEAIQEWAGLPGRDPAGG